MTTPTPDDIPLDAYASTSGELRALARVILAALGMLMAYWSRTDAPEPYRQAAQMVAAYLKKRYG